MKADNKDRALRDLFRRKLENTEVIPGSSVKSELMNKLAWREFLHFIPGRFNIYYLAGILAVAVTTILLITSISRDPDHLPELNVPDENNFINPVKVEDVNASVGESLVRKSDKKVLIAPENLISKEIKTSDILSSPEFVRDSGSVKDNFISQIVIDESLNKKGLSLPLYKDVPKLQMRNTIEKLSFEPSVTAGCTPLRVQFINYATETDSCYWTFGDGGSSSDKNPEWIFDLEGEYRVVQKVFNANRKIHESSVLIKVYPKPSARFEVSPVKAVLPDDEIRFLNYSSEAVKNMWNFGDGNTSTVFEPVHKYEKFGIYNVRLVVFTEYGCSDSLMILNVFSGSEFFIDFPNAFIPNPDGPAGGYYSPKSDEAARIFHPVYSGVSDYQLKIFNKTGMILFETNDINIGWDGYYKGQLCNRGVYIWKVRGNFRNGETFIKMGDVTLLMN